MRQQKAQRHTRPWTQPLRADVFSSGSRLPRRLVADGASDPSHSRRCGRQRFAV